MTHTQIMPKELELFIDNYFVSTVNSATVGEYTLRIPRYVAFVPKEHNYVIGTAIALLKGPEEAYHFPIDVKLPMERILAPLKRAMDDYRLPINCLCADPIMLLRKDYNNVGRFYLEAISEKVFSIVPAMYVITDTLLFDEETLEKKLACRFVVGGTSYFSILLPERSEFTCGFIKTSEGFVQITHEGYLEFLKNITKHTLYFKADGHYRRFISCEALRAMPALMLRLTTTIHEIFHPKND